MFFFFLCFFFNDTATTKIYTYVPTLSLHDALPSSAHGPHRLVGQPAVGVHRRKEQQIAALARGLVHAAHDLAKEFAVKIGQHHADRMALGSAQARSEEHTSELQSLMRISYAVFCLKNKKKIK